MYQLFRHHLVRYTTVALQRCHYLPPLAGAPPSSITLANQPLDPDLRLAPNYSDPHPILVEHCGIRTPEVWEALAATNHVAELAKNSVGAGIQMGAYKAMFKTNLYQVKVYDNFKAVYDYRGSRGLKPDPSSITFPRFACATTESRNQYGFLNLGYDPLVRCSTRVEGLHVRAFYAQRTAYIFLCPTFFGQSLQPVGRHCPTVEDNEFSSGANPFYRTHQVYTLLGEMVRLYLGTSSLSQLSDPKETVDWNQCVEYSGVDSCRNPANYILYAACE